MLEWFLENINVRSDSIDTSWTTFDERGKERWENSVVLIKNSVKQVTEIRGSIKLDLAQKGFHLVRTTKMMHVRSQQSFHSLSKYEAFKAFS